MAEVKGDLSTLQFRLPRSIHDRLKIIAVKRGKTVSEILREFITLYVEREEGK